MVPKHQLFYYVGLFYFFTFSIVAYLLAHPTYGLPNTQADPSRILGEQMAWSDRVHQDVRSMMDGPESICGLTGTGWFSYCAIESFGSIGVSLFWAFVNATIDLEGAKRAYGLIIAGAQIGSIIGPSLVIQVRHFDDAVMRGLGDPAWATRFEGQMPGRLTCRLCIWWDRRTRSACPCCTSSARCACSSWCCSSSSTCRYVDQFDICLPISVSRSAYVYTFMWLITRFYLLSNGWPDLFYGRLGDTEIRLGD